MSVLGYHSGARQDPPGRVTDDRPCRSCGANLRGMSATDRCPACGQPVGRTLHGDLLAYADPGWLARLRSGLYTILWATVVGVALAVVAAVVMAARDGAGGAGGSRSGWDGPSAAEFRAAAEARLVVGLVVLGAMALFAFGVWAATEPDPERPPGGASAAGSRQSLRALVVLSLAASAMAAACDGIASVSAGGPSDAAATLVWSLLNALLQAGLAVALGRHLSDLARRVPARTTADLARVAGLVSAAAAVLTVLLLGHLATMGPATAGGGPNVSLYGFGLFVTGAFALAGLVGLLIAAGTVAGHIGKARTTAIAVWFKPPGGPRTPGAGPGGPGSGDADPTATGQPPTGPVPVLAMPGQDFDWDAVAAEELAAEADPTAAAGDGSGGGLDDPGLPRRPQT